MLAEAVEAFAGIGFETGFQVEKVAAELFIVAGGIGMAAVADVNFFEEHGIVGAFQVCDGASGEILALILPFWMVAPSSVISIFAVILTGLSKAQRLSSMRGDIVERILRLSFSHGSICKSS